MLRQLRSPGTVLGLIAVVIAAAGLAMAANTSGDGTITACVSGKSKQLSLASSKNRCGHGEKTLQWNQRGPAGARGPDGPKGADGPTGPQGVQGIQGVPGNPGADASATTRATSAGEVTTSATSPTDLGGPSVTVQVPAGGALVLLGFNFDGKNATNGNGSCVNFFEGATSIAGGGCVNTNSYTRGHGANSIVADAGQHTYTVKYYSPIGTLGSFQNRTLIASVLK